MEIIIQNVHKQYRKFTALNNIDLHIGTGLFGLLGPNGAGKSTLMKILSTILPFEKGEITIGNYNLDKEGDKIREELGYLPQSFQAPTLFTGRELLHYVASMKGVTENKERTFQIEQVLKDVNLINHADKKIKGYSGGMLRRLGIAQELIGNPQLIIMDEPTAGLDPSERIRFRNLLERLGKERTIILSTHIISDIETSCEQVGVLHEGNLLFHGLTKNLAKIATRNKVLISAFFIY